MDGLKTGLKAWWDLEELSGTRYDATDNDHDLTDNNTVGRGTGIVDYGADFDTANLETLSLSSHSDFQQSTDKTFNFWMKVETGTSDNVGLFCKRYNTDEEYMCFWVNTNNIYFRVRNTATTIFTAVTTSNNIEAGTWYNIQCDIDIDNQIRVTVNDGTPLAVAITGTLNTNSRPFIIGAHNGSPAEVSMNGIIDSFGVWNRVLDGDETEFLYNSGSGRNYAGLDVVTSTFLPKIHIF